MSSSRRRSNGESPLVNQQRQITSFFTKATSSPSSVSSKQNPNPSPGGPTATSSPSPISSKQNPNPIPGGPTPLSKKSCGKEVVGKRIKVFWPLDKSWYEGYVKLFNKDSGKHLVQYDDAEEELLDLEKEKIEWVPETVKTLKRLRRGPLSTPKEESNDVADDDSSDEDWEKSGDKNAVEVVEEEEELMDLEDEEDDEVPRNKGRRGSGKRKLSGGANSVSAKKTKSGGDVGTDGLKANFMESPTNAESKYWDFK